MLAINQPKIYRTGATLVVEALKNSSVTHIFGYPGASILSLYNELAAADGITHCLCRHEQACVHSAEGYARTSGKPGVVLVTSGPGATNTLTGIANAYADSTPLVIIAGAANEIGGKVFQNVDFPEIVKTTVKAVLVPKESDNLYDVITFALKTANTGRKGPVVVQLTRTVLESKHETSSQIETSDNELNLCDVDIKEIVSIINTARNPVLIVGGGVSEYFNKISELAIKTNIPVVTTLMGSGNISTACPSYCGMIGINGSVYANSVLNDADLIIAFGVAFSDRTTCKSSKFANGIPVININITPYLYTNVNIVKEINYDCGFIIDKLLKSTITPKNFIVNKDILIDKRNFSSEKMETQEVLEAINNYTKRLNPVIITDVGQHQILAAKCFDFYAPKRFLTPGGMGTMGYGLPASCGVHFAMPDAYIINITGDGSFQMNIQELATVSEYKIPVKIFVMNNGYLGMIRQMQEKFLNNQYYQSKLYNPEFIKLAAAYGIKGYRITSINELKAVLPDVFKTQEPIVVDCITNAFEIV